MHDATPSSARFGGLSAVCSVSVEEVASRGRPPSRSVWGVGARKRTIHVAAPQQSDDEQTASPSGIKPLRFTGLRGRAEFCGTRSTSALEYRTMGVVSARDRCLAQ